MFSVNDIYSMWSKTLSKFKKDFPDYYALLKGKKWTAGVRDRKNSSFGWADNREKKVIINWHLHKNSPEKNIIDTMLHELAHAIDFCNRGRSDHGAHWKKIAAEIGAIPKARSKSASRVEYKYVLALNLPGQLKFIKGYNRRPTGWKVDRVAFGVYLTNDKVLTLDNIWLYSWRTWVKLCEDANVSPYREDHKLLRR